MLKITAPYDGNKGKGTQEPHWYDKGYYVASLTRFKVDHIYVDSLEEIIALYLAGYPIRMSCKEPNTSPSLISPKSISMTNETKGPALSLKNLLDIYSEDEDLDREVVSKGRKEQSLLRAYLFDGKEKEKCTICHRTFPVSLLVAAHIKPRSECTSPERKDYSNIVTPMCKLGCDELYEKGFIVVKNGHVVLNRKWPETEDLKNTTKNIVGNLVHNWSNSKHYYNSHAISFLGKKGFDLL